MKKYLILNETDRPAIPLYLTVGIGVDAKSLILNTDGVPLSLTEDEYKTCKDAVERYKKERMVSVITEADVEVVEVTPVKSSKASSK